MQVNRDEDLDQGRTSGRGKRGPMWRYKQNLQYWPQTECSGLKRKGVVGNNAEVSSLTQAETYGISVRQRDTCAGVKQSVQTHSVLEFLKYRLWAK